MNSLNSQFIESMFALNELSHNAKAKNNNMSYIGISTMTMICDLNCEIDIQKLGTNFTSPDFPVFTIKQTKRHDEYELTKRGKTIKSFYNQITLNYVDHSTKSIKLFSNGRLQITGAASVNDTIKAVNNVISVLKLSKDVVTNIDHDKISPKSAKIAMINSNFSFNMCLDILKLKKKLEETCKSMSIIYNPDVYPGLKIKHTTRYGTSSIFVFTTGNVVITGVKSIQEIHESFSVISDIVNNNILQFKTVFDPPKPKVSKNFPYKYGYPSHIFDMCMR